MSISEVPPKIKLNYCSFSELTTLPNIGRKRALSILERRQNIGPFLSVEDLESVTCMSKSLVKDLIGRLDWSFNGYFIDAPRYMQSDARNISEILNDKVDIIITSPPYWQKRNYGHPKQIGQEDSPDLYVRNLCDMIDSWTPILHRHSSIFINIGDTFRNYSLVGIPSMVEIELLKRGWLLVNKIIWSKRNGVPEPLQYRLANRYEVILQLARYTEHYSDCHALAQYLGNNANPGNVWDIRHGRNKTDHLAPFPDELVRRVVHFACPEHVCNECNEPFRRKIEPTFQLDITRPQARRAIELFENAGLTDVHLKAIRAVGISDAGKAQKVQGMNLNAEETIFFAEEAKRVLGGYFREFTFSKKVQVGWSSCKCPVNSRAGIVLDPFVGSGTTVRVAYEMGRSAIGSDLILSK